MAKQLGWETKHNFMFFDLEERHADAVQGRLVCFSSISSFVSGTKPILRLGFDGSFLGSFVSKTLI